MRLHHKSRNGCTSCKRRRVKCDERKPSCLNCERNQLSCSLSFLTPAIPRSGPGRKVSFQRIHISPLGHSINPFSLDGERFELLHHYTFNTCLTLGTAENMVIWQELVLQMAHKTEYLMNGMLAVSALHLACLQPDRRTELVRRASRLKDIALRSYRQSTGLKDPTAVHAAVALSGFIVQYVLALSGREIGRVPSLDDSSVHWFHLTRGLIKLAAVNVHYLQQGPFRRLMEPRGGPETDKLERNPHDIRLVKLSQLVDQMGDQDAMTVCRQALDTLRRVGGISISETLRVGLMTGIHIWPGVVSHEFVVLLHERRPEALVILAHYSVLLKQVDLCWYTRNVGEQLLLGISEVLDPKFKPWIEWALNYPAEGDVIVKMKGFLLGTGMYSRG